jgi:hypothetical protein
MTPEVREVVDQITKQGGTRMQVVLSDTMNAENRGLQGLYLELPNDTVVELHKPSKEPGRWTATVIIGGEPYHTTVHCLQGALRDLWEKRALRGRGQKHQSMEATA